MNRLFRAANPSKTSYEDYIVAQSIGDAVEKYETEHGYPPERVSEVNVTGVVFVAEREARDGE